MQNDTNSSKVIEFKDVFKVYPGNPGPSLREVNFFVQDGEFFCIVGPSGCGKSTLLKIIAGLESIKQGEVTKPDHVAMVFQSGALFPWLNVYENVALGLRAKNESEKKVEEQCRKYIELTGLVEFTQKFPRDLSGGQKQRVGIARALAVEPKVLLLDEPFSALDTATTEELHRDLIKIWQTTKKTIVMVSHSIEEAVNLADRIMLMKAGQVQQIFQIKLPYPRREKEAEFMHEVQSVRKKFFE
jgi:NitT/TauT family transport system ATP-binding protein